MPMTRTARRARPRRAALALVGALVAGGALSGCAQDRLGAAALIGDRVVSTEELQEAAQSYLEVVPGADPADVQVSILQRMIVSEVIDEAAHRAGVAVREGRVAAERDELLPSVGGRKGLVRTLAQSQQPTVLAPSDVDRWIKDRLLFNAIAAEISGVELAQDDPATQQALNRANRLLSRTSRSMDIEVNPRYGRWDPSSGISPLVSGGLSKTVDELSDSGS
jgi:hypothetical protein